MPDFPTIDFEDFHEKELQRRISAGHGEHAFAATSQLGGIAFENEDGCAYTYLPDAGTIRVCRSADDAKTVVVIQSSDFSDLVSELAAGAGLLYGNHVHVRQGDGNSFLAWEPGWRALFNGRPIFNPSAIDLRDRYGAALDPTHAFTAGEDSGEIQHFLRTAGFVHLRSLFSDDEVRLFRSITNRMAAEAREDDGNSWWGIDGAGQKHLTRILDARQNETLHNLVYDSRLTRLINLFDADLEPDVHGEAVTVLFKVRNLVKGLGDLPWHRDCGMGGHATHCPTINLSVFLSPCNRQSGGLWMLPGSAPYSCPPHLFRDNEPQGCVLLNAAAGDVTLHLSDTMHAAFPPTGNGILRQSLNLTWKPSGARPHDGQAHYNDAIKGEDGVPIANRGG